MAVSSSATTTTTATMPVIGGGGGGVVVANAVVPPHQNTVPSATAHPLMSIPSSTTITTTKTTTATTATNPTINLTFSSFPPANPINLPLPPLQPQPQPQPQPGAVVVEPSSATANPLPNIPTSIFHSISADLISNYSTSSSTSTDDYGEEEEEEAATTEGRRKKRKRKWKDFFERLMKEVIRKQEDLQKRFLEAVEKREQERAVREEAWRMQEMARINREREILAQERSIAAAKDAAVMAFLQKMSSEQQQQQQQPQQQQSQPQSQPQHPQPQPQQQNRNVNLPPPPPPPLQVQQPLPVPPAAALAVPAQAAAAAAAGAVAVGPVVTMKGGDSTNGEKFMGGASSSRWPKTEVQALIKLRTSLDAKYQENGPKGPLWEEISGGMRRIGYNRSAKRCKEKWENINKYFKKVKESNKKRPEDSKTCPYFHQLDALYREKNKFDTSNTQIKPENAIPLMVRPEQQWPPQNHPDSGLESDPMDHNNEEEEEDKDDEDDDDVDDDEEDDDDGGGNYELVANRPPAPATSVSAAE